MVAKVRAHNKGSPKSAPALAAVVTVPGPINAADMTDQNRIFRSLDLMDMGCTGFPDVMEPSAKIGRGYIPAQTYYLCIPLIVRYFIHPCYAEFTLNADYFMIGQEYKSL
jgi:hypothetical protein